MQKIYNYEVKGCVFCGIAEGKKSDIVVFPSIDPKAPIHLILIPKSHVENLNELEDEVLVKIKNEAMKIVGEKKLDKMGYRLVINGGVAKAVSHLHFHLLGGVAVQREV